MIPIHNGNNLYKIKKIILILTQNLKKKNLTLIPLRIFFSRNWAKVEVALAKGKKVYDKREAIKKKELQRAIKEVKSKYS